MSLCLFLCHFSDNESNSDKEVGQNTNTKHLIVGEILNYCIKTNVYVCSDRGRYLGSEREDPERNSEPGECPRTSQSVLCVRYVLVTLTDVVLHLKSCF